MECCVVVKQGPRKGLKCQNPAEEGNPYCGRHIRQKEYDNLIKEGKNPCNQFFRACNNLVEKANIRCEKCLENSRTKKNPCKYQKCKNHVLEENTYCKKHERQKLYDEEKEKNIKYCNIGRGCFTLLEKGGKASCESCLEKEREYDNKRYTKNRELSKNTFHSDKRVCAQCSKEFDRYLTKYNKESVNCLSCQDIQNNEDSKRIDRSRNYKTEMNKNKQTHFKQYFRGAIKRDYEFKLTFEEFCDLVSKACKYCGEENIVNGIDRVDNTKGYILENCVPCCELCNQMKLNHTVDKFIGKSLDIAVKHIRHLLKDNSSLKNSFEKIVALL